MIWSAVLPGAALRVLRTAAGRRALHVALLVGGVFVLGLLCGGRAQAADEGPGGLTEAVGRVFDGTAQPRSRAPEAAAVQDTAAVPRSGAGALLPGLRPVAESVVQAVDDRVVRPAGDAVVTVTEGVGLGLPGPSGSSGRPTDPLDPIDVPDLLDVPGLIDVPDLIDLPGSADVPDPDDVSDPADRGGASGGARPAVPDPRAELAPAVVDTSRTADPSGDTADARFAERTAGPAHVVGCGPQSGVGAAPDAHPGRHRAGTAHTGYAPAHPAPHGDPDGALGTASGVDQGTPRHGDTRALAPQHRLAFRLVPGAPERADAAGVREPYRDIPVSPA
ncbi:hypothetical protein ACFYWD_26550 [Streptomyces sp. NPDC003781]|uniref:hypothetical protein n=1 Tax=Streptomyces sp. NPDC003781 TaxID=3364686 RepID=UPI0036CA151A